MFANLSPASTVTYEIRKKNMSRYEMGSEKSIAAVLNSGSIGMELSIMNTAKYDRMLSTMSVIDYHVC